MRSKRGRPPLFGPKSLPPDRKRVIKRLVPLVEVDQHDASSDDCDSKRWEDQSSDDEPVPENKNLGRKQCRVDIWTPVLTDNDVMKAKHKRHTLKYRKGDCLHEDIWPGRKNCKSAVLNLDCDNI